MDEYTTEETDLLRRGIEAQNAKLARYEEALRFYADPENFCVTDRFGITECKPPHDYRMKGATFIGETARKALEDNQ